MSEAQMKLLYKLADSFIYVVSRIGATGTLNSGLPSLLEIGMIETMHEANEPNGVHVDKVIPEGKTSIEVGLAGQIEALNTNGVGPKSVPARFGEFGGQYVPESLMDCLSELEEGFNMIKDNPTFWEEYRSCYPWMGAQANFTW